MNFAGGAITNAQEVAKKEFYPEAALRKYEWFKDAYHQMKAQKASIEVKEQSLKTMCKGEALQQNFVQCGQWQTEVSGMKAGLNSLVSEYNSASDKFNWGLFNAESDLPPTTLQRY